MEQDTKQLGSGVVTFLDVLGWKGVYDRKEDAIPSLTRLVKEVLAMADRTRGSTILGTDVKSISDTIAILTLVPESQILTAIGIHGAICKWLIPESIRAELPVRGATAYGEFQTGGNILVGKAIDEAASWHEQGDWIGVHLTPSAEFVYGSEGDSKSWIRYDAPLKSRHKWRPFCVNWTSEWEDREREIKAVQAKFFRLGPIVPEISGKFINTLSFIEAMGVKGFDPDAPVT